MSGTVEVSATTLAFVGATGRSPALPVFLPLSSQERGPGGEVEIDFRLLLQADGCQLIADRCIFERFLDEHHRLSQVSFSYRGVSLP